MKTKCERPLQASKPQRTNNRLPEIRNRAQQSVQTLVSFDLLNKMLRYVGIILPVEFSKKKSVKFYYNMNRHKKYMT